MIVILGILMFVVVVIGASMNGLIKGLYFLFCLLFGGLGAHAATKYNLGVDEMEYEEGISIRQESNTGRPSAFFIYAGRGHLGGGVSGGK
jgi:hypothetical protein